MNKNVKINEMDKLQKELEEVLIKFYHDVNVEITKDDGRDIILVNIYENDENYKEIPLIYNEKLNLNEYIYSIEYYLRQGKYNKHSISLEQKYISELLKEYGTEDLFIKGNYLCNNTGIKILLNYFDKIEYDIEECFIYRTIYANEDDVKYRVDLENETIEYMNDEKIENDSEGTTKEFNEYLDSIENKIDVDKLKYYIEVLNEQTNENIHYIIKNNQVWEIDIKNDNGMWCKLEQIQEFNYDEEDKCLVIKLKNNENVFLDVNGGCM